MSRAPRLREWHKEALRTNLWLVPSLMTVVACVLFAVTLGLDRLAYHGHITFPAWMNQGGADAARQVLIGIAAGVITVAGVVFSVTIVVLTLASQQFGPRMLRNFIRDRGTQFSIGAYMATFVFAVLVLGSIGGANNNPFVPHLSITTCLILLLFDIGVLIYFIHHIATMIQLSQVMAGIAQDLRDSIDIQFPDDDAKKIRANDNIPEIERTTQLLVNEGRVISANASGYLQYVNFEKLTALAAQNDAVVQLLYRPGHFVTEGLPMARVWPPNVSAATISALERFHVAGPYRTLTQDPVFAIDQLVEIAIRALSTAVNDTFTGLTCIDWLTDGLCLITRRWMPQGVHRDRSGAIRVIQPAPSYQRIVDRAFDKVRQASDGMPATLIRQMDGVAKVLATCHTPEQMSVILRQAEMISRAGTSIKERNDDQALQTRYELILEQYASGDARESTRTVEIELSDSD